MSFMTMSNLRDYVANELSQFESVDSISFADIERISARLTQLKDFMLAEYAEIQCELQKHLHSLSFPE